MRNMDRSRIIHKGEGRVENPDRKAVKIIPLALQLQQGREISHGPKKKGESEVKAFARSTLSLYHRKVMATGRGIFAKSRREGTNFNNRRNALYKMVTSEH